MAFYVPVNPPELPREYLVTTYTPPGGSVISVASGGNLQTAINNAVPGDIIELEAGATFTGNFTLPNKTGNAWVVIRTATIDANLPPEGTRITPASVALLSRIQSNNAGAAIATDPSAHHYRFIGLEIGVQAGSTLNYGLLVLGDSTQTAGTTPHDFIIDRCYIHGNATGDQIRGVAMNSNRTAVIDSYISECHGVGFDTQAICGWNGVGPFKIVNNYLSGAGENFMIGGADPSITNLIPSDLEFRNNHLFKPLSWKVGHGTYAGIHWSVKNIFELKNCQRVLIDGNTFENNWQDAQDGFAIVLKVQNQDGGAPWTFTGDVTFTNNVLKHSGAGINLLGRDPYQTSTLMMRFLFRGNLFTDITGATWGATHGRFFQTQETADVTFDHNTFFNDGTILQLYGGTNLRFVWTNNIGPHNTYGVIGDSFGTGNASINAYLPGCIFTNNIIMGGNSAIYPSGNYFPANFDPLVGFTNYAGGDYTLTTGSTYHNLASPDGLDLGWITIPAGSAIAPPLLASTATLFAPKIIGTLKPSLLASGAQVFAPTLTYFQAGPAGRASMICGGAAYGQIAFGGAIAASNVVLPDLIASTSAVFTPSLTGIMQASFLASTAAIFTPALSGTLFPAFLASGAQVFAPTVAVRPPVQPVFLASSAQIFAPKLIGTCLPSFITSTGQVFTPNLPGAGASQAGQGSFVYAGAAYGQFAFGGGGSAEAATAILPSRIESTANLFTPNLRGILAPAFLAATSQVFAPTVTVVGGSGIVSPVFIGSTASVFTPTVSSAVIVSRIESTAVVFAPAVMGVGPIRPPRIESTVQFFTPFLLDMSIVTTPQAGVTFTISDKAGGI